MFYTNRSLYTCILYIIIASNDLFCIIATGSTIAISAVFSFLGGILCSVLVGGIVILVWWRKRRTKQQTPKSSSIASSLYEYEDVDVSEQLARLAIIEHLTQQIQKKK